jgi:hypothetical protein
MFQNVSGPISMETKHSSSSMCDMYANTHFLIENFFSLKNNFLLSWSQY